MSVYADSSIIAALYIQEAGSARAQSIVRNCLPLPFTPWHRLEVRNAIRCSVEEEEARAAIQLLEEDLSEQSVIMHQPVDWTDCLRRSEELSRKFNPELGVSSPDLFHVACALELNSREFFTFDERQAKLAKAVGLKVKGL